MASFNRVIIAGNLTRDPEYKQLTSGQAVCRLGLATNRQFKNRQTGTMVQEVCYVDIDVWGAQAESCKQYLQKGRPILVEGRLKLDSWEDQEGKSRSKHSIVADRVVFLSGGAAQEFEEARPELDEKGREAMDQVEQVKNRVQAKTVKAAVPLPDAGELSPAKKVTKKATTATGEIAFDDAPPFLEELPF
jgi:single-strand DNA-binding protein